MENLQLTHVPHSKTGMLIRKPVAEVFTAFVDPAVTTKFWFTKSSGSLEVGQKVQWDWEMYGVSILVTATAIEPNKRIVVEWPGYGGLATVEWAFASQTDGATFVNITEAGFVGDGTNWSNRWPTRRKDLLWYLRASKHSWSTTSG